MNYTFNLGIGGMTFCVHTLFNYTGKYTKEFWIDGVGEHVIDMTPEDIQHERELCMDENNGVDPSIQTAPDYYLESVALLRKLADFIVDYNRILMHGSAIAVNGKGYIFTALSGTGKSTHTALLRKLHGENAVMINDDKPFLFLDDGKVYISGTPWMGKHHLGNNITVPLEGIFFLRRSEKNELAKLSPDKALNLMLAQCHRPVEPMKMMETLGIIDQILSNTPLYDFGCNMDISAAELSSSVMK